VTARPDAGADAGTGPRATAARTGRGGAQRIPRPVSCRPGAPPPWAGVDPAAVDLSLAGVTRALERMRPARRLPLEDTPVRPSAVLAALYEDQGEAVVILTRRAQTMRTHRGEVSFPGGGADPADPDLWATALREADEEIRLDPSLVSRIGELDHLQTITGRSYITPYVGALPARPELVANPAEVELVVHQPLRELLDGDAYHAEHWGIAPLDHPIHFFDVVGDTIWGATASMLVNFLTIIASPDQASS
jgi:8-oxo-dGTP pyrophosphatase MutT (NUDIX family)